MCNSRRHVFCAQQKISLFNEKYVGISSNVYRVYVLRREVEKNKIKFVKPTVIRMKTLCLLKITAGTYYMSIICVIIVFCQCLCSAIIIIIAVVVYALFLPTPLHPPRNPFIHFAPTPRYYFSFTATTI